MKDRCCATCRYLSIPPDSDGKTRIRRTNRYECNVKVVRQALPECITRAFGYEEEMLRTTVYPTQGESCPMWLPPPHKYFSPPKSVCRAHQMEDCPVCFTFVPPPQRDPTGA